ncbi:OmpA family protein [Phenylobacterium kunshanense]|uniref:OmpA family protein n=1 Tax=Phenylobacterium kunshanense TaxID=1445034 RepID=A0A328BIY0_9CAUL|nr:OmpA family protein [Phenylobacterium kunshanense]RAK64988.1 OmpA family protein [Phenylobacterium kunshanense]
MNRIGWVGLLAMAATASGCASVRDARDRIVRASPTCEDLSVPVYFEPNVAVLTREGQRVIAAAARQARGCTVRSVRVVGLADATGDPAANLELSKQRAASVAAAVARAGLPAATFDVEAFGQAGSITPDGRVQPVRRRADITLDLARVK